MVRSFALIKLAQAISAMQFRTRTLAIQARANIVELFNLQIEMFTEDAIVNILLRARDYAVQSVTQTMATLVPVVTISASLSKPSLYWADRLYRDVSRATELSDRNDAHSPAFMPSTFEALSQ
jgi:prophage DNA circulation protein